MDGEAKWADVVNLVLGAWLFVVPLESEGAMSVAAAWNTFIVGGLIGAVAIFAMMRPRRWPEWVNLVLGMWVFISPFMLSFWVGEWPLWNHLIVGAAVASMALWALVLRQRLHAAY